MTDPVLFCMQFPVGRTRLETVAVIVCAVIMSIATVLVIRESIGALVDGLAHREFPSFALPAMLSSYCMYAPVHYRYQQLRWYKAMMMLS